VEVTEDGSVRLAFGSTQFCIDQAVAQEIAECIRDAFSAAIFGHKDPYNKRDLSVHEFTRYRPSGKQFQFVAEGEVDITDASPGFLGSGNQTQA
jgi:hypothetical protein